MKKNILFYFLLASVLFVGCKKDDGSVPKAVALERIPAPLIVKDAAGSVAIDMTNLAGFNGKVNIGLYFPTDIPPSKFDIVIRKNNNNGNIKLIQAGVAAFPTTISITAAQIVTLFGGAITLGDNYDIGADVYAQSGKKYEAFPAIGLGYAAAFQPDHPGFSPSVRYSAACQYNAALFPTGNYIVLQDDWADYAVGDIVPMTQIDATHLSFKYAANSPLPIVITINPLTNVTSATKQQYGNYGPPFGNLSVESVNSPANLVLPCAREIGIRLHHTSPGFDFGDNTIRFRKQ
jgi:hypothetical protein